MMGPLLRTEFLKIKRKGFWLLTFLGPFGVVALQMVNYGVRKDYLFQQSDDRWAYYLHNVHDFTPLALVLGIVILTSLMASIENETNAWKQLMSLPVSKYSVYLSKFTVLSFFLLAASFLLMVFTLLYGIFLDLGPDIPYADLARYSFYPFFASLPVLALQLWAAVIFRNQGIPVALGVFGVILTYSSYSLPDWLIWKWPTLMNGWNEPVLNVLWGLLAGCALYVFGMIDFARSAAT